MTRALALTLAAAALLAAATLGAACIGTTPEEERRNALPGGGDDDDDDGGSTHRPGQPCLLCHDFALAGTVYLHAGDTNGLVDAEVDVKDDAGHAFSATTNAAGTFYVTIDEGSAAPTQRKKGHVRIPWELAYPLHVSVRRTAGATEVAMRNVIHREGSCGTCHEPQAGAASAGRIFVERTP